MEQIFPHVNHDLKIVANSPPGQFDWGSMANKRKTPNVGYIRPEVRRAGTDWQMVNDTVAGSRAVKNAGEKYLPKPKMSLDALVNDELYKAYVQRACFYPVVGKSLSDMVGEVFAKDPEIELPGTLQPMIDNIDGAGVSLMQQGKSTVGAVLKHGRGGLLADFPPLEPGQVVTRGDMDSGKIRPKILRYRANQIINWEYTVVGGESVLTLLVLAENMERPVGGSEFERETALRLRVYRLGTVNMQTGTTMPAAMVEVWEVDDEATKTHNDGTVEYKIAEPRRVIYQAGQTPYPYIPFNFIGAVDNDATVDPAPLLDLAELSISHYRNSADSEHSAFYVGQPTPVITGLTQTWVDDNLAGGIFFGSSHVIPLPAGASASLLQAGPNTLAGDAMARKESQMKALGARLIDPGTVQRTAFEVGVDKAGEVSLLANVASNVSAAYRGAFFNASRFIIPDGAQGLRFELNTKYDFGGMTVPEVVDSWMKGLLSKPEARDNLRRKGAHLMEDDIAEEQIRADGLT